MGILEEIEKGNQNIANIEKNLFDIVQLPLYTNIDGFNQPEIYATYKHTGGNALGTVGTQFEATQPRFIFDSLINGIRQYLPNVNMNTFKMIELKGGSKLQFSFLLKEFDILNGVKKVDSHQIEARFQTGFDGKTKNSFFINTHRLICSNGMKVGVSEFQTSFKNTKGNVGKIASLANDFKLIESHSLKTEEFLNAASKKEIKQKDIDLAIKLLFGVEPNESEISTRKANILTSVNQSIALELGRTGNNMLGLLNGITHYTNHSVKNNELDTLDYIYSDSGETVNNKIFQFVEMNLN